MVQWKGSQRFVQRVGTAEGQAELSKNKAVGGDSTRVVCVVATGVM